MFRKLLKHDMRALFKYWWIAALASAVLSVIGGFCLQIIRVDYTEYNVITTAATIGMILIVMALMAFCVINTILIYVRFYKNFFTDEGYLTFTLPVKRSQLLGSKLFASTAFTLFTMITLIMDFAVILSIGFSDLLLDKRFLAEVSRVFSEICKVLEGYLGVYIIEAKLLFIATTALTVLIVFACITIASALSKKHKIITAIGVYYAYSAVVSSIMQSFMLDETLFDILERIAALPAQDIKLLASIIALGFIALTALLGAGLYIFEEYLLRRRLNLD